MPATPTMGTHKPIAELRALVLAIEYDCMRIWE